MMKVILSIVGILFILAGSIWFLQGINVIPGSFMTGQIQWAIYGAIAIVVGISLMLLANQRRDVPRK